MSTPNKPGSGGSKPGSARRRIAGESAPGSAAGSPPRKIVKRPTSRKPSEQPEAPADESAAAEAAEAPAEREHSPDETSDREHSPDETSGREHSSAEPVEAPAAPKVGRKRPSARPAPPSDEVGDDRDAKPPRDRGRLVLVAVAAAALIFGVVGAGYGVVQWRQGSDVASAHTDAAETAASAAETIFSYRYDRLDAYLQDARETMTASFGEDFESISPALGDLAPQRQIQVEASARDAAALPCGDDCDADRARVLIFIDQARLADGEETPTVFGNRVEFSMVQQDGRWLVDDITAL